MSKYNYKTNTQLEEYTQIKVSEEKANLIERFFKNNEPRKEKKPLHFPFLEGVIEKETYIRLDKTIALSRGVKAITKHYFKISANSENTEIIVETHGGMPKNITPLYSYKATITNTVSITPLDWNYGKTYIDATLRFELKTILETLLYISVISSKKIVKVSERKILSSKPAGATSYSPSKNIIILQENKISYVVSDSECIKFTGRKINKRFPVMGHTRTYKSGLVIWIESYIKGKDKKEKVNKTYLVK